MGQPVPGDGIQNPHLSQHWRIDHFVLSVHQKANRTFVATMSFLHRPEDLRGPCDFCVRRGERGTLDTNTVG